MSTSSEIKARAKALAEKTDVNSITPKEVGGIMYDLASHSENVLRNGGTLGIRKVYESVAAMEADSTNPKDFWGNPIKKGNLVVIYDGTPTGTDNNQVYAFMNPGWELATDLDAGYATRSEVSVLSKETDAKLSELGAKVDLLKGKRLVPKMGVVWGYEGTHKNLAAPTFGASVLIDIYSLFVDSEGYSYISNGNITGYGTSFPALVMFDKNLNLLGYLQSLNNPNKLDLSELVEGTRFVGLNLSKEEATLDKLYGEALPRIIYNSIQDYSNQLKSEIELNSVYESKMKSWGYQADFNDGYINPKNNTYDGTLIRALNFGKEVVCSYKVSGITPLALVACYSDIPKPGNNSDIYIGTGTCSPYGDITLLEGTKYFVLDIKVTDYNFDDGSLSIKLKIANSSVTEAKLANSSLTEAKLDYNLKTKLNSIYSPKLQSSGCHVDFNSGYVNKTNDNYDGTIIRAIDIEGDLKLNYKVSGINPLPLVACYSDIPQLGDNSNIYLGNSPCSSDGIITLLEGTKYFIIDIRKSDSDFANGTLSVRLKIDSPSIDSSSIRVVAWGDSLTQGAGSDKHRHQSNFISALENKGYFTDLSANSVITYPIMIQKLLGEKYDVLNCGVGGENINTIASRVGANVAFSKSDFILPSTDSAVQIGDLSSGLGSAWGADILPLLQGDGNSVNPCYVQGVECELKWTGTSNSDPNGTYTLKRKHIGERSMSISTNTAIIFSGSKLCSNTKLAVVWCWANGGYNNNITELTEKLDKIIAHLGTDKYVIVGIHTGDVTFAKNQESVLASKYGNRFFNWREYVSSHALYDWGITPTTDNDLTDEQVRGGVISDVAAMAEGSLPMSLWRKYIGDDLDSTSNDKVHLTAVGYGILGFKIVERFKMLGYV